MQSDFQKNGFLNDHVRSSLQYYFFKNDLEQPNFFGDSNPIFIMGTGHSATAAPRKADDEYKIIVSQVSCNFFFPFPPVYETLSNVFDLFPPHPGGIFVQLKYILFATHNMNRHNLFILLRENSPFACYVFCPPENSSVT